MPPCRKNAHVGIAPYGPQEIVPPARGARDFHRRLAPTISTFAWAEKSLRSVGERMERMCVFLMFVYFCPFYRVCLPANL